MVSSKNGKAQEPRRRPRFMRSWLVGLAALSFAALYFYHQHRQGQESLLNSYYLRSLGEVAVEFDARLDQLLRVHDFGQQAASIKALFPTYSSESDEAPADSEYDVSIAGGQLTLMAEIPADAESEPDGGDAESAAGDGESTEPPPVAAKTVPETFEATVDIGDMMPLPRGDFSAYLLVGPDNRVLGATGGKGALSIINTRDISVKIWEERSRDWLELAAQKAGGEAPDGLALPGYSYDVDIELASGSARVFVYPFAADPRLSLDSQPDNNASESDVFLVGVVPENLLAQKENRRWQVSVLLLALTALGFLWTMLRLFMLSSHQPVSGTFYAAALAFSYLLFVLSVAALYSWAEQRAEVEHKHHLAWQVIDDVKQRFEWDLYEVLQRLEPYRQVYRSLLGLKAAEPRSKDDGQGIDTLTDAEKKEFASVLSLLPAQERVGGIVLRDGRRWTLTDEGAVQIDVNPDKVPELEPRERDRPINWINLFGPGVTFPSEENFDVWFDPGQVTPGNVLNVFLMNDAGTQTLPVFYFIENNNEPRRYSLSHRHYFKRVRDQKGWNGSFEAPPERGAQDDSAQDQGARDKIERKNFYIQRLLNLTSGTRGTTLGMPLIDPDEEGAKSSPGHDMVLGSDIVLPSLSLMEPLALCRWKAEMGSPDDRAWPPCPGSDADDRRDLLLDMTVMVVDQRTGVVLYHVDDDRSMIENLFHSGRGADAISQLVRAGRATHFLEPVKDDEAGQPARDEDASPAHPADYTGKPIPGHYHGERGWFHTAPLTVAPWSLVVFVPAANTDTYMTNLFLMSSASMAGFLLLFALALLLVRRTLDTESIKKRTGIPLTVDRLRVLLFASVLLGVVQLGYWLGSALERDLYREAGANYSALFAGGALLLALLWGVFEYWRCCRQPYELRHARGKSFMAAMALAAAFLVLGASLAGYLHRVGKEPIGGLEWYYGNLYEARLNKERTELENVALTRYTKSITRHRIEPLELMPISDSWRQELRASDSFKVPEDVGSFSELTNNTGPGQWAERYLLADAVGTQRERDERAFPRWGPEVRYYVLVSAYFILLALLWVWFNARVLSVRLFGPPGLLGHLTNLAQRAAARRPKPPDPYMVLDFKDPPEDGLSLALLLQELGRKDAPEPPIEDLGSLVALCPLLKRASKLENPFPGVKIRLGQERGLPMIELWDLDDSLAQAEDRALLLQLLNQLKSLRVAGKVAGVRVHLGFDTLEQLLLKANMLIPADAAGQRLSSREYAAWAECLMDFRVRLPEDLVALVDQAFLDQEVGQFPLLKELTAGIRGSVTGTSGHTFDHRRWADLRDWQKDPGEWASINAILLCAGALFRSKWESCSTAERLALYHLALHKRINPLNTELLEQLALKGLIAVERGRIRIVNNSFAYFVRHAEDPETLKDLVESAEAGPWKDYRLPITLLILIGVVAIALTSGNSLYVIVASLLGLLGTLGTLTNSARLIQENLNR